MTSIHSQTGQLGYSVRKPAVLDNRPRDEKDWEKEMVMKRIHELYEEPIKSLEGEALREKAIQSLYARKRSLEIDMPLILM